MNSHTYRNHWYVAVCIAVTLVLASSALGVTVKLRSGKLVAGSLVSKNDTNVVLKTTVAGTKGIAATRTVTIAWRDVTTETLKALHPELYKRLKEQAEERARKKSEEMNDQITNPADSTMVNYGGRMITHDEWLRRTLSKVRLQVTKNKKTSSWEPSGKDAARTSMQRDTWGTITVRLDGLDHKAEHKMKVVYNCYLGYGSMSESSDKKTGGDEATNSQDEINGTTKDESVTGVSTFTATYESEKHREYKEKLKQGWSYIGSGKRRAMLEMEVEGWDIVIWLDDTMVYKEKKGEQPVFFHVTK